MKIVAKDVSKKFQSQLLFKNFSYTFSAGNTYAITGPNGAGKSTLIGILSGYTLPTIGTIAYRHEGVSNEINSEELYKHVAVCAPYTELIEEFTLTEMLDFHFQLLPPSQALHVHTESTQSWTPASVIALLGMQAHANKYILNFSSGMKQRVKLALAACNHKEILLLDEPTSNLDTQGVDWYFKKIVPLFAQKICIIASNVDYEINHTPFRIHIPEYAS